MKVVLNSIRQRQAQFAAHPFLKRLEQGGSLDRLADAAPALTFWVLGFQDVLRINEDLVRDEEMKQIAAQHRHEDNGHDRWFLHDVRLLGLVLELRWVFGPDHEATRDATYAIISEVYRAKSDYARIALLYVLEATGSAFFSQVADYVEKTGFRGNLLYFGRHHIEVEKDHELWERAVEERLSRLELPAEEREEIQAMVARTFAAFHALLDEAEVAVAEPRPTDRTKNPPPRPAVRM